MVRLLAIASGADLPLSPVRFDQVRTQRTVREMMKLLSGLLPDGCEEWFRENQPYVARFLDEASAELEAAVVADDRHQLVQAMDHCTWLYLQVERVYRMELARSRRLEQYSCGPVSEIYYQNCMVM